MKLTVDRANIDDDLQKFQASRHDIMPEDVDGFEECVSTAKREEDIQTFLKAHPQLLCVDMRSGHGEWVIPKQKLGNSYVTDFICCHGDSAGFRWNLVELERADCQLVTRSGDLTREVNHAIGQVRSWRSWLGDNLDCARRSKKSGGMGLHQILPRTWATIYIGRRENVTDEFNMHRNELRNDLINIYTYDSIIDTARRFANTYKLSGADGNTGYLIVDLRDENGVGPIINPNKNMDE